MRLRLAKLIWAISDWNTQANEKLAELGCYIWDGKDWRTKHDPK